MEITKDTKASEILQEYGDIAAVMETFGIKRVAGYETQVAVGGSDDTFHFLHTKLEVGGVGCAEVSYFENHGSAHRLVCGSTLKEHPTGRRQIGWLSPDVPD